MVCSAAIHLAAFAIVDGLLSDDATPSVNSTPLLVSILRPRTTADLEDHRLDIPRAENDLANTVRERRASGVPQVSSEIVEPTEMPVAAETGSRSRESEPELTTSGIPTLAVGPGNADATGKVPVQEAEEVAPVRVVATTGPEVPVVAVSTSKGARPHLVHAEISSKQKKMLKAKVRKWTDKLHRMPDKASELTWKYKGQEYQAKFSELPAPDDMGIQRVIVEISTEEDGKRMTSRVHMKRLAFSNFAQFVNRWDPNVEIHNDELDGRFHSNTEIRLSYDRKVKPLFKGKVTTTSRRINFSNSRGMSKRDQIFVGGLQTGVRSIRLPKHYVPFPDEGPVAGHQVQKFDKDTRITFHGDGSYAWQTLDSDSPQQVDTLYDGTTYFVADSKVNLHVKGTVNGKVLVYSPERIVIEDDLVYAQHPEEVPDADDFLGLVSGKYVDIAPADITGPGNLLINAAIYAKRRFAVRGYRSRGNALLYLYGSLTVGSLSATEPRYHTRIEFDQRLEQMRPPGFPMTDRYEVESWDTTWTVEPIE